MLAKTRPIMISHKIDSSGCISFILRGFLLSHKFYIYLIWILQHLILLGSIGY